MEVPPAVTDQSPHPDSDAADNVDDVAHGPTAGQSQDGLLRGARSETGVLAQAQVVRQSRWSGTQGVALLWLFHADHHLKG